MENQARIVIVGGGIMGIGLLYHLAEPSPLLASISAWRHSLACA